MSNLDVDQLYSCTEKIADEFRRLATKEERTDKDCVNMAALLFALSFCLNEFEKMGIPSAYAIEQCCCLKKED